MRGVLSLLKSSVEGGVEFSDIEGGEQNEDKFEYIRSLQASLRPQNELLLNRAIAASLVTIEVRKGPIAL